DLDLSATVKAYFALKLVGDDPNAPHMRRARAAILAHGGAGACNVFTRIALALFGLMPWDAVPRMPVEMMLLPSSAPFNLDRVSYWSRTVIVPLLILMLLKPKARNPQAIGIDELFLQSPFTAPPPLRNPTGSRAGRFFLGLDRLLKQLEPHFPKGARRRAVAAAVAFIGERLNGDDGLGGIFPAIANTVMAFDALGYAPDHPQLAVAKAAIRKLLVIEGDTAYCQPCLSPVWDTGLVLHALMEAGVPGDDPAIGRALRWLAERQITTVAGDWAAQRPGLRSGGWAFQYRNDHYPDVDDTAVVAMAFDRAAKNGYPAILDPAVEWIVGMQSENGGWGAFDAENTHYLLNHIPFADHGALLDPPTSDVSARCIGMLVQLGDERGRAATERGLAFLRREQESDGSWFGRWGTNYIYGTWSALCALNAAGVEPTAPEVQRAVDYLLARQNPDGGWGEDCASYWQEQRYAGKASTPSQTAWALLGLMAAGAVERGEVRRGIDFLLRHAEGGERWPEDWYTAVGFPRVFYLRYHGYAQYFPLWALARYRNLMRGNDRRVAHGL
ncbi:MAG TPA: squalene--hopene cyclase, partial [Candidatus Sulfotelmatobacter sp.]|nr:squalene--hopene cyclase [Candidatus Sulfotelmatobacter sp.]